MLNNRIVLITVLIFFFILLSPGFILTIPPRWSDLKLHKFRSVFVMNEPCRSWWLSMIFHTILFTLILYLLFYKTSYFKGIIREDDDDDDGGCDRQSTVSSGDEIHTVRTENTDINELELDVRGENRDVHEETTIR